jgi:hypothetical protein
MSNKIFLAAAGAAAGAAYEANGVDWNGSSHLNRTSSLRSDGGQFTLSVWFKKDAASSGGALYHHAMNGQYGAYPAVYLQVNTNEAVSFDLNSYAGSILLARGSGNNVAIDGQWNHWMGSWNGTSGHIYINGTSYAPSSLSNGTVSWSSGLIDMRVGGTSVYTPFNGSMAEFYLNDVYIDLSQASNRAKFYDANDAPVDLGANGENPTGSTPLVYFKLNYNDGVPNLGNNLGSAGNYTVTGSGQTDGGIVTAFP